MGRDRKRNTPTPAIGTGNLLDTVPVDLGDSAHRAENMIQLLSNNTWPERLQYRGYSRV